MIVNSYYDPFPRNVTVHWCYSLFSSFHYTLSTTISWSVLQIPWTSFYSAVCSCTWHYWCRIFFLQISGTFFLWCCLQKYCYLTFFVQQNTFHDCTRVICTLLWRWLRFHSLAEIEFIIMLVIDFYTHQEGLDVINCFPTPLLLWTYTNWYWSIFRGIVHHWAVILADFISTKGNCHVRDVLCSVMILYW
jgi:hypothetical protein